jgi:hypothetical protein
MKIAKTWRLEKTYNVGSGTSALNPANFITGAPKTQNGSTTMKWSLIDAINF